MGCLAWRCVSSGGGLRYDIIPRVCRVVIASSLRLQVSHSLRLTIQVLYMDSQRPPGNSWARIESFIQIDLFQHQVLWSFDPQSHVWQYDSSFIFCILELCRSYSSQQRSQVDSSLYWLKRYRAESDYRNQKSEQANRDIRTFKFSVCNVIHPQTRHTPRRDTPYKMSSKV